MGGEAKKGNITTRPTNGVKAGGMSGLEGLSPLRTTLSKVVRYFIQGR